MGTRRVPAAEFRATCLRIIREMESDGQPVTITRRGQPVALLSPLPAPGGQPFIGKMQGTVLAYDDPFAPAARPSDWAALRD